MEHLYVKAEHASLASYSSPFLLSPKPDTFFQITIIITNDIIFSGCIGILHAGEKSLTID